MAISIAINFPFMSPFAPRKCDSLMHFCWAKGDNDATHKGEICFSCLSISVASLHFAGGGWLRFR